jgi:drug/metabolite transporter (DMT)-like permease
MDLTPKVYVIAGIITTVAAQIFLKRGGAFEAFKRNWLICIFLSLFFYAISFLTYYLALKHYDISMIQPIMMVSIVALIALYGFMVGESFNTLKLFGIVLAVLSIFFISGSP